MTENDRGDDRLVYSESRNINIGDYESRQIFVSLSSKVRNVNGKALLSISESQSLNVDEYNNSVVETYKNAKNIVNKLLDHREEKIRKWASDYTGDYFLEKLEGRPK